MYLGGNNHNHNSGWLFSNPAFKCVSRIICISDTRCSGFSILELVKALASF